MPEGHAARKYGLPLYKAILSQTRKPLLVYPNAGEVWDAQARRWLPGEACGHRPFDEQALTWAAAGARLIGGCLTVRRGGRSAMRRPPPSCSQSCA